MTYGVSREMASLLVLNCSIGSYLLKESKTFVVLSLNYYGSARHILLSVKIDGSCIVDTSCSVDASYENQYWFKSVQNFLDYFRKYPLYLKNDQEPIKLSGMVKNKPVYV